jgi:hypothetical protein
VPTAQSAQVTAEVAPVTAE